VRINCLRNNQQISVRINCLRNNQQISVGINCLRNNHQISVLLEFESITLCQSKDSLNTDLHCITWFPYAVPHHFFVFKWNMFLKINDFFYLECFYSHKNLSNDLICLRLGEKQDSNRKRYNIIHSIIIRNGRISVP
jgi:hypothetical protein